MFRSIPTYQKLSDQLGTRHRCNEHASLYGSLPQNFPGSAGKLLTRRCSKLYSLWALRSLYGAYRVDHDRSMLVEGSRVSGLRVEEFRM